MSHDLNQIYKCLPESSQKKIDAIVMEYLSALASNMGFQLVEKITPANIVVSEPIEEKAPKTPRAYVKFPITLHGRNIPSRERLLELYKNGKGAWEGELTQGKLNYLKSKKLMSYEDIFPFPPPENPENTIIKRTDDEGSHYVM